MKKEVIKVYPTTQELLYTICDEAWTLCSQHLAEFSALKSYYTPDFVKDAVQAVSDARDLPDAVKGKTNRSDARIELMNSTKVVQDNWQLLKIYILKAFPKDKLKVKLEAAGAALYAKASYDNWSAVRGLIETANTFIGDNLDALLADGNMPATFPDTFRADGEDCQLLSTVFFKTDLTKQKATKSKLEANNAIYLTLASMLRDGQRLFKKDVKIKEQFVMRYLIKIHGGDGSASLTGYIYNASKQPLAGVTITAKDQKYTATSNKKGYFKIGKIAEGTYTFIATCPGYAPAEQPITLSKSTRSTTQFELPNLMKKVA